jgi:hypothetical protein
MRRKEVGDSDSFPEDLFRFIGGVKWISYWQAYLLQQCGVARAPVQAAQQGVHFGVDESAITSGVSPV